MEAHSAPGKFRVCRETRTFQMRTAPPLLLLESFRELKRIWSTNRVGGLSSPLLVVVVVVVVASIVVVSKFVGSPCVLESFTTHSVFFVLFACLVSLGLWWDFFWLGHDGSRNRSQHHVFFCVYRRFFAHMAACRGFESVERIRSNKGVKCTWG